MEQFSPTRWFLVRHAPVRENNGSLYGRLDFNCDCSDSEAFGRLRTQLKRLKLSENPVVLTSTLKRTSQTLHALQLPCGDSEAAAFPELNEQDFGDWEGKSHQELDSTIPEIMKSFWDNAAESIPPGGESFRQLCERVSTFVGTSTETHRGQDILCICHGGTIRSAVAHALGLSPTQALQLKIDTLSLTVLEAYEQDNEVSCGLSWAVSGLNLR